MIDEQEFPQLIPPHGGYRELQSYRTAEIVYDATVVFCRRFISKFSRTHDQKEFLNQCGFTKRMVRARSQARNWRRNQ